MKLAKLRERPQRIAVIGFGRFGQFIAKTFQKYGEVVAISRSDYSSEAQQMGVEYHPLSELSSLLPKLDVVVLACSILSFEKTVSTLFKSIPSTTTADLPLVVDVLSVKEHPRRVLLNKIPPHFDILCTHPMFGPESGKNGWSGLNFVYERTRIAGVVDYGTESATASQLKTADTDYAVDRCERFLSIFEEEGCKMVNLSCEAHDTAAANSQFITHLVGRILGRQGLDYTPIDTKGFESVMKLIESTNSDSFDLFYGLYKYNANSMDTILKMKRAMDDVEEGLKIMEREDVNAPGWGGGGMGGEASLLDL
ncbi:hypothetical protein TrCOL_g13128 [Triparma columacea]|uniref:Prephenate/arogenate dehydrogenase domain-containing protein n=1 Tax=Triparma columacea TaxID=722753 RepID=A0A9W7G3G1_9STRA|nr:hypothetical protein TrCOL_g13128 [Triparma columacea]